MPMSQNRAGRALQWRAGAETLLRRSRLLRQLAPTRYAFQERSRPRASSYHTRQETPISTVGGELRVWTDRQLGFAKPGILRRVCGLPVEGESWDCDVTQPRGRVPPTKRRVPRRSEARAGLHKLQTD